MHRSLLLLLMSALLLSAAAGLPLSLEESAEKSWLDLLLEDVWESEELLDLSHENSIHKRGAKDSSGSSEEHKDKAKDKANNSGSSSEEQKTSTDHAAEETTTQAAARRRRQANEQFLEDLKNTCDWAPEDSVKMDLEICMLRLRDLLITRWGNQDESHITERSRRQVSGQDQQRMEKASGEVELDAQAEKELDEEMARAVADVKDNGSIEDYAQGCEVMEVSSKEANEATYAE
ncbi:hypothetical protein KR038_000063 [Drosophila bunnanda]|nr:hypothetical protein KR038_000063 [Drosophila bunnanda]